MKTLGQMVRSARENKDMTRIQVAKKLDITPEYLGHIERDAPVRVSPRVAKILARILKRKFPNSLIDKHNTRSTKWYRNYRKKSA